MSEHFTLIGIDGGATKVSAWLVKHNPSDDTFSLTGEHAQMSYSKIKGFIPDFKPLAVPQQLQERDEKNIKLTEAEIQQGNTFTESCARVIETLVSKLNDKPILVGIGMPGLKTEDRRGICVLANGPRIINYASCIEERLQAKNIRFAAPIAHIGSDADYCGIGEMYARDGSFRDISNAYYLGGGTGTADALRLRGKLVPFDQTNHWLAKTWELKNDLGKSLERYASASGLQFIYSEKCGIAVDQLNRQKIFPPQIANRAVQGEKAAIATFKETSKYLALLLFERISTLYCGTQNLFEFVNPKRDALDQEHPYRLEVFHRLVIGQRMADLLKTRSGKEVLAKPIVKQLSRLIDKSTCLLEKTKKHYLHGKQFREELLVLSPLREAPALGAGIDAYLVYTGGT